MGSKKQGLGFIILIAVLIGCQRQEEPTPHGFIDMEDHAIYPHHDSNATGPIWQHIKECYRFAQDTEGFYGVPACISLAQAILESGGGTSNLGEMNNFFGHRSFYLDEAHYYTGKRIKLENGSVWRIYDSAAEAYNEHGRFYLHTRLWDAQTNKFKYPYRNLIKEHYTQWLIGLNGYASDPNYGKRLKQIIEQYNLTAYNL